MDNVGLNLNLNAIKKIVKKWQIKEFSLFGSALRGDFSSNSDIDVLIEFDKNVHYSLFDLVDLKDDLEYTLKRRVDLVEKASLKNPFRRKEILGTAKKIYAK